MVCYSNKTEYHSKSPKGYLTTTTTTYEISVFLPTCTLYLVDELKCNEFYYKHTTYKCTYVHAVQNNTAIAVNRVLAKEQESGATPFFLLAVFSLMWTL